MDAYQAANGPVVELGVGDGRIAVQAAARGVQMIGVDLSSAMLERCRQNAEAAGVAERMTLIQADFRHFDLPQPAGLIALPYHSLGHLQSLDDKRDAIAHVFSQLRPGGVFIFDDFLMTPALIDHMRRVQLRAEYTSASGADTLLWVTSLVNEASQSIRVVTWEDEADADGLLVRRRYRRLSLSWLEPVAGAEPAGRRRLRGGGLLRRLRPHAVCRGHRARTGVGGAQASVGACVGASGARRRTSRRPTDRARSPVRGPTTASSASTRPVRARATTRVGLSACHRGWSS